MLAHHIIERRIQGNRILGKHMLGNHVSLERIVLRTPQPINIFLAHNILERYIQGNRIIENRILGNDVSLDTLCSEKGPQDCRKGTTHLNAASKATVSMETVF